MENDPINQHYATLLGLGEEWRVTKVDLNVLGRRLDIFLEYAADAAICPACGKLDMRPGFVRVGSTIG